MKNTTGRCFTIIILGALSVMVWCFPAHGESEGSDQWHIQLAPYAWLAGQKGSVATLPGLPPGEIDIDFYDHVLGNINGAIMLLGEARKGRFGVVMDIVYTDIEMEDPTPYGILYSTLTSQTKSWMVSGAGFYRLAEGQNRFLDIMGGVRYWSVDSELTLKGPLFPSLLERSVSNKEDWVDPIIGLKGFMPIGESKFFVSGAFLIGGFGVGSDFMWDAMINIGYQWTKGFSTTIGYRYLDVDYEKNDFLYDVAQRGFTLGLSWRF